MQTISSEFVTLSKVIECDYATAFDFLKEPLNQKVWAIHFFQDIEEVNGEVITTLPFGKLALKIKAEIYTLAFLIFI